MISLFSCSNTAAYDAAIHCSLQLSIQCTPKQFLDLLPDENNLKQVQDIMCKNLHGKSKNNSNSNNNNKSNNINNNNSSSNNNNNNDNNNDRLDNF